MRKHKISDAEFEILKVIWSLGKASVGQIHKEICLQREEPITRNTIQVQIKRLMDKGRLERELQNGTYVYLAVENEKESCREIASDVTERVFGGSISELVKCLYEGNDISDDDLKGRNRLTVKRLLRKKKPNFRRV